MLNFLKRLSIEFGVYHQARRVARLLRKKEKERFRRTQGLYREILGPETRRCFDIGANIGELSEAMLAEGHQVVSFEPNDDLAPELRARCGRYPKWSYCLCAMSSSPGIAELHVRQFIGQASLKPDWGVGEIRVEKSVGILTLDIAIAHYGEPSFIKIDTEGHDLEVLAGLSIPIAVLVFEFHVTESGLSDACKCLERISNLADYECNIVDGFAVELMFDEWIPVRKLSQVMANLSDHQISLRSEFGDIYCRRISESGLAN